MGMDVRAFGDGLDGFADLAAVFDDGLVFGEIAQGDFVAQRNVVAQFDAAGRLAFEGYRAGTGALLQVGDGHADIIVDVRAIECYVSLLRLYRQCKLFPFAGLFVALRT